MANSNSYITIPKKLIAEHEQYGLCMEAVLLYAFLVDRFKLSAKNDFTDDRGRIFVLCSRENAANYLGVSVRKVYKLFRQLTDAGFLYEERCGQGLGNRLYPLVETDESNRYFCACKPAKIADANMQEATAQDVQYVPSNNNEDNKNDDMSVFQSVTRTEEETLSRIFSRCDLTVVSKPVADLFVNIITRMYYSNYIKIGEERLPKSQVRRMLEGLNTDHIIELAERLCENEKEIVNKTAFLMAMLINILTTDATAHLFERPPEYLDKRLVFNFGE